MSDNSRDTNIDPEELTFNTSHRFDEILNSLSNTQRRRIISHLRDEGPASQSEIAHQLVRWNYDSPSDEVLDRTVERLKTDLYHTHLPQLEDAGLIEYDRRSKMLLVRDLPELAELCLDHCESVDLPSECQ